MPGRPGAGSPASAGPAWHPANSPAHVPANRQEPPGRARAASTPARRAYLGLPARRVLAGPEHHRLGVVENMPILRVAAQRAAGALGDVAEVAEQRALVSLLDLGDGFGAMTNR